MIKFINFRILYFKDLSLCSGRFNKSVKSVNLLVSSIINNKYLLRPTSAYITFTKEHNEFKCEALLHLSSGLTACCTGKGREIYDSYQKTILRLQKILRRHKRKIRNHHYISEKINMELY